MTDSLFFIPGHIEKYYKKIKTLNADYFIVDLEDSVPNYHKESAYKQLQIHKHEFQTDRLFVRIERDPIYIEEQIKMLANIEVYNIVLPKTESAEDVEKLIEYLGGNTRIILLFETPYGLINIERILKKVSNIYAIGLGGEDYKMSLGATLHAESLLYPRSVLLTYGRAYNIKVYDTVYFDIKDDDGFLRETEYIKSLGFDGKFIIHPRQIELFNQIFKCDIEKYELIIEKYQNSVRSGQNGIIEFDGKYFEKPHIEYMKKIVNKKNTSK